MKITRLAHSCFELVESLSALIDPYLGKETYAARDLELNPDVIAITHGHSNHLSYGVEIARRTGCLVLSTPEVADYLDRQGARAESLNIGGSYAIGKCNFHMT